MILFRKRLNGGVEESLRCDMEYARRILRKRQSFLAAIAPTGASARFRNRRWDEALHALKDATIVYGQGKLARSGAGDGLRASRCGHVELGGWSMRVRGNAVRAMRRALPAVRSRSDV
jgi:hypothetical protein